jgi:hypothetical protein
LSRLSSAWCTHRPDDSEDEGEPKPDDFHLVQHCPRVLLTPHGEGAGRDRRRTSRGYVHDMVEAVRKEVMPGATLDDTRRRVTEALALSYEKLFSIYRPWPAGLLRNIERTYAMVS